MRPIAGALFLVCVLLVAAVPALATSGPTAVDDDVAADGHITHIGVLDNDLGDFDPGSLTIVSNPSRGTATVIASGSPKVKYSANGGEAGVDSFEYSICDAEGTCSVATVRVNIGPVTTTVPTVPTTTSQPDVTTSTTGSAAATSTTLSPATTAALSTTTTSVAITRPFSTPPSAPSTTADSAGPDSLPENPADPFASDADPRAGTTVGERRGIQLDEDIRYLGRTGRDTIEMVAVPAIMVSGLLGFLMIGLPQNAFGAGLGFLLGFRRRRDKEEKDGGTRTVKRRP